MVYSGQERRKCTTMSDIIADNQTEAVLSVLDRGEADDKTRDRVSAALLRTQTRLLEDLAEIKGSLWKPKDLEDMIDRRHAHLCSTCPTRLFIQQLQAGAVQQTQPKRTWFETLCTSESIRYFILMLILVWAVIYIKAGPGAVESVKGAASSTISGGLK